MGVWRKMKKTVLFSPTGYVGSFLKKSMRKEKDVRIVEITRNSILEDYEGNYDIMIYSASVIKSDVVGYVCDNVLTVLKMIDFCKRHRIKRIIYLSSDSIYGELNTDEVSEDAIMVNPDFYGITKYLAEKIVMQSGIPYYILRMPGIVGKVWQSTYLYRLIDQLCMNETITVYNSGRQFNNVVDLDDLIHFIMLLCNMNRESSEIFLLGNTEKTELIRIVNYAKNICQSTSEIDFKSTVGKRYFTLDVSKALEYGYVSKSIWNIIEELYELKMVSKNS